MRFAKLAPMCIDLFNNYATPKTFRSKLSGALLKQMFGCYGQRHLLSSQRDEIVQHHETMDARKDS